MTQIGNRPWTPAELTVASWHDASDDSTITEAGGTVSQIDDKSGNGHHWTQGTAAQQPARGTRKVNGRDTLDFDGAGVAANGSRMVITNPFDLMTYDVFFVVQPDSHATNNKLFGRTNSNGQMCALQPTTGEQRMWAGTNFYNADTKGYAVPTGEPSICGFFFRSFKTYMYNGAVTVTGDTPSGNPADANAVGYGQFDPTYDGLICEAIVVPELSDPDRFRMEGYLAWKWGLVANLPANHPFKLYPPFEGAPTDLLWTPNDITTEAWFDAADEDTITSAAGSVSQWDDKSGNDRHVSQGTGSKQPSTGTRTMKGLNVLEFDPTGPDNLQRSGITGLPTASHDFYAVQRKDVVSTPQYTFVADSVPGSAQIRGNRFADDHLDGQNDSSTNFGIGSFSSDTKAHLLNWRWSGSDMYLRRDAVQLGTDPIGGTITLDKLIIGSNVFGSNQGLDGELCEFIWTEYLSDADRQKMEGYLAWKWGFAQQLPASHPYRNNPPTA